MAFPSLAPIGRRDDALAGLDGPRSSGKLNESINLLLPLVPTDPILLIFITGALFGVAATLLVGLIPDVIFVARELRARRKRRLTRVRLLFP